MKIWFEQTKADFTIQEDCSKDCPPDIFAPTMSDDIQMTPDDILSIADAADRSFTNVFWQKNELYRQECGYGYTLVCDPTDAGKIAVMDGDALALFEQFRIPTSLNAVRQELPMWPLERITSGILFFQKLGFLQNKAALHGVQADTQNAMLRVWLHITNACNLNCAYCYIKKSSDHMSDDTAYRAIDSVVRSAVKNRFKVLMLKYAGGEASLRIDHVLTIHDYALSQAQKHALGLHAYIMSNGVFLAQEYIDQLRKRDIGVMISLDGIGSSHDKQRPFINGRGSFKYVDRTITKLLASGLIPGISVTVSRRNLTGLPALMEYILDRTLPFSLNYYRDNECSTHIRDLQFEEEQMIDTMRSVFSLIEHRLPKQRLLGSLLDKANPDVQHSYTCGVGHNYMVIDQRGGVAKCQADIKRTVTTIAAEDPLLYIRNDRAGIQRYAVEEKEGCRACEWRLWCTGGCPLLTYKMTGRSDVKSPNCNIYKALFPAVLRLEALRLLKYASPISV